MGNFSPPKHKVKLKYLRLFKNILVLCVIHYKYRINILIGGLGWISVIFWSKQSGLLFINNYPTPEWSTFLLERMDLFVLCALFKWVEYVLCTNYSYISKICIVPVFSKQCLLIHKSSYTHVMYFFGGNQQVLSP